MKNVAIKDESNRRIYTPDGKVLSEFIMARNAVDIIRGPIGSGKSMGMCARIWMHALEQDRSPLDGLRKSRWLFIRNTYNELKTTTIRTWLSMFPEEVYGRFIWSPPFTHRIRVNDIDLEVIFLATESEADVAKLRSFDLTGGAINELQYIPRMIFEELQSRTGRYPNPHMDGIRWSGVICDMNEPGEDHFIALMRREVPLPEGLSEMELQALEWPADWGYHLQPPALIENFSPDGREFRGYEVNPAAENLKWLKEGYYRNMIAGKSRSWIESRMLNRISLHVDGSPVHPSFRPEVHVARDDLVPVMGRTVFVGLDFGRKPAALFAQLLNNRWNIQFELLGTDEGATLFAPRVKRLLAEKYPGCPVRFFGDPKGRDKGQSGERTAYDVFESFGMRVEPARHGNGHLAIPIETRLEAVDYVLNQMVDGLPRLIVSPVCRTYRAAMAGKYCWKRGDDARSGEPDKRNGRWSDIADAGQYLLIGGGEGRAMVERPAGLQVKAIKVMGRRGAGRRGV